MPRTVVYLRFDRPRDGFVDPKPVDWSNRKENELRAILRDATGNLDWEKLAQHFNVPTSYVLQQAAWLYEMELDLVKRRMSQFAQGSHIETRVPRSDGDEHLFMSQLHAPHMHIPPVPPVPQTPQLHSPGVLQKRLSQVNLRRATPPQHPNSLNPTLVNPTLSSSGEEESRAPSLQNALQRSQLTPEEDDDENLTDSDDLEFPSRRLLTTSRIDTLDTDSSAFSDSSLDGLLPTPDAASDKPHTPPSPAVDSAPAPQEASSLHGAGSSSSDDDQVSRSALEAELLEQLNDSSEA